SPDRSPRVHNLCHKVPAGAVVRLGRRGVNSRNGHKEGIQLRLGALCEPQRLRRSTGILQQGQRARSPASGASIEAERLVTAMIVAPG
ncbi:MAG: hypothetical protein WBW78_13930, partial [Terrimicrobiaceae bacterium]